MKSLTAKVALITGGTSGIGLAIAKDYIANGAKVVITGRRDTGHDIAEEIKATFIHCDVTDEANVISAYEETAHSLGKLDVVVLNAGVAHDTSGLQETPSSVMRETIDINLMGVYYGLKHAPPNMNDAGSIIVTGSAAGSGITMFGYGEYSASKAGAAYLMRTAALEFAPRGIRVNAICPASIAGTGMMTANDGGPMAKLYASFTALNRMGTMDEVVAWYTLLACDAGAFVTGQEICVDGGATAGIPDHTLNMLSEKAGY